MTRIGSNDNTLSYLWGLGIDKRYENVSGSFGRVQPLMQVGQSTRVHQHPALLSVCHRTILPDEAAASALVVHAGVVERHVDGVDGGVVVRPQKRLFIRPVSYHEHVGFQGLL